MSGIEGGFCHGLEPRIQDMMWGTDSAGDVATRRAMIRTAIAICDQCPLQAECIATGIVSHDRWGVIGGLGLKGRRLLARMAIEDGCPCTPRDTAPREALVRWIRTHPGHVKAARIESNLRRRRDERNESQAAWRATHQRTVKADKKTKVKPESQEPPKRPENRQRQANSRISKPKRKDENYQPALFTIDDEA